MIDSRAKSSTCREMPAPGALPRAGCAHQTPRLSRLDLLGPARARLWRRACQAADHRPCAGRARRQSHRQDVHGRPLRRFSLRAALSRRIRQPADFARRPTTAWRLRNAYISAATRCAPPENKPLPSEIRNCSRYLEQELDLLQPRAVLALGAIAFRHLPAPAGAARRHSLRARLTLSRMAPNANCRRPAAPFRRPIIPASKTRRPAASRRRCSTPSCGASAACSQPPT